MPTFVRATAEGMGEVAAAEDRVLDAGRVAGGDAAARLGVEGAGPGRVEAQAASSTASKRIFSIW
jgi:hypothetical protein